MYECRAKLKDSQNLLPHLFPEVAHNQLKGENFVKYLNSKNYN